MWIRHRMVGTRERENEIIDRGRKGYEEDTNTEAEKIRIHKNLKNSDHLHLSG